MSRTWSSALRAHFQQATTTLAFLMKIVRTDDVTYTLTSHDRDIEYSSETYRSGQGRVPTAAATTSNLDLANLNISGVFTLSGVQRSDLLAHKFDHAAVTVHRINWADMSQGALETARGNFGIVKIGDHDFSVDLFGIEHRFLQQIGRIYQAGCDARLGDERCKVDTADFTETGTVLAVINQHAFTCTLTNLNAHPITEEDWFAGGPVTWTGGNNQGLVHEVRSSSESGGVFTLHLKEDAPYTLQAGDTFTIIAGCQGRKQEDCIAKFNNIVNFRGFAELPGPDLVALTPPAKGSIG